MPTITYQFSQEHVDYFREVEAIIEATSYESLKLWCEFFEYPREPHMKLFQTWQQSNPGHLCTIGQRDGNPICVCIDFNILDGKRYCFWEPTSELVDHKMIKKWFKFIETEINRDIPKSDAMNFPPHEMRAFHANRRKA